MTPYILYTLSLNGDQMIHLLEVGEEITIPTGEVGIVMSKVAPVGAPLFNLGEGEMVSLVRLPNGTEAVRVAK
jgi:hypothetical protein